MSDRFTPGAPPQSRVTYEVSVFIDPALAERFERYMLDRHIPEVLATGCFTGATLERSSPGEYRTRYEAAADSDVDRYLAQYTADLRADFVAHFPEARASRARWTALGISR